MKVRVNSQELLATSRTSIYMEGPLAAADISRPCNALFCTPRAISTILRSEDEDEPCPKVTDSMDGKRCPRVETVSLHEKK